MSRVPQELLPLVNSAKHWKMFRMTEQCFPRAAPEAIYEDLVGTMIAELVFREPSRQNRSVGSTEIS
jgi:hypothetical protein